MMEEKGCAPRHWIPAFAGMTTGQRLFHQVATRLAMETAIEDMNRMTHYTHRYRQC